jgi:hypothetical protein
MQGIVELQTEPLYVYRLKSDYKALFIHIILRFVGYDNGYNI